MNIFRVASTIEAVSLKEPLTQRVLFMWVLTVILCLSSQGDEHAVSKTFKTSVIKFSGKTLNPCSL